MSLVPDHVIFHKYRMEMCIRECFRSAYLLGRMWIKHNVYACTLVEYQPIFSKYTFYKITTQRHGWPGLPGKE
jgi:hypothetical protein